jgi:hypothetical protein
MLLAGPRSNYFRERNAISVDLLFGIVFSCTDCD